MPGLSALLLLAALDVQSYSLRVSVAPPAQSINGTVDIEFAPLAAGEPLRLKASTMTIEDVTCGSQAAKWSYANDILTVEAAGAHRCSIRYGSTAGRGLTINNDSAYTVFHTDRWMPSNPEISDRAFFNVNVSAPPGFDVIITSSDIAFPSYLFGFAVGHFHSIVLRADNPRISVHGSTLDESQLQKAFSTAPDMLDFFERIAGTPYPVSRYDQIVLPGAPPQELAGGTLLSAEYVKSVLDDPTEDYLIAHELSHQWWGNLLTARDWSSFWLHEGFATYMVAAWKEHKWSQAAYEEEMALASIRLRRAWAERQTPLVSEEATERDRALVYSRGALVLHTLRRQLGDRSFWAGIRAYSKEGVSHPLTTSDLRTAMETAAPGKLKRFFEQWTTRSVLPNVEVSYTTRGRDIVLNVAQLQSVPFDLTMRITAATSSGRVTRTLHTAEAKKAFKIRIPRGDLTDLYFDGADTLLGTYSFQRPENLVLMQLRDTDTLNRLGAIDDARRIGSSALRDELARMLKSDPSRAVRRALER